MRTLQHIISRLFAAIVFASMNFQLASATPLMIVGNDEKLLWDDDGKRVLFPAGKDSVMILDLADPENPKIVANLPLKNSVVGPPVNVAIDPTNTIALVADSVDIRKEGDSLKMEPDNKVYIIDLKARPPKLAGTVTVGRQPSGLSFGPLGDLALVANSADKSISVLAVKGTDVKVVDTIDMGDVVSHVTFTPDGKCALATKFDAHKIALLDVSGHKVIDTRLDLPTGQWPFNVAVAPGGRIALSADSGNPAGSDGSVDTVSVIDLEAMPPRIIDRVVVGDGPEGLAISPKGDAAVAVILAGSNMKNAYFHHRNGTLSVLQIEGKKVTHVGDIEVGAMPEGVAFTPDGKYLLVGNYLDQDISILKVNGVTIVDTGKRFKLPGHPASMGMSKQ
jgi:DNA-binding beta-propeller fold protein YncE